MDKKEFKNPDQDPKTRQTLGERIASFWQDHRLFAILLTVLIVGLAVTSALSFNKKEYGVYLLYAGPTNAARADIYGSIVETAKKAAAVSESEEVAFSSIVWVPKRLVASYTENDIYYNGAANADARESYQYALVAGEYSILLIDPELYDDAVKAELDIFVALDDLGIGEDARFDAYALKLASLPLYQKPGFCSLPSDTLVVMRKQSYIQTILTNKKKRNERYERQREAFVDLVNYE